MEKIVKFYPAYDKRNPDPKKNYGIGGATMLFLLKGELGATQFVVYTNWYLPHVAKELEAKGKHFEPLPADVGYHSPKPLYEDQPVMSEHCEYLDGKPCYYDGSGLHAIEVFEKLVTIGDEAVWRELEDSYVNHFGELK